MLKTQTKLHTWVFFHSNRCGPVFGIFNTKVCFDHFAGTKFYRRGSMYDSKEIKRKGCYGENSGSKSTKVFKRNFKEYF